MTVSELKKIDKDLQEEIEKVSSENGLKNDFVWAICDGIYSAEKYLSAQTRIMWVLKEPYDDFVDGEPYGGGWSITKDLFNEPMKFVKGKTGRMIGYVSYGILNEKKWNEIDYFEDNPNVAEFIKQIAYINLSKMPAKTNTSMKELEKKFQIWKPIVLKQIEVYNPEVLIFGNTFKFLKEDLFNGKELPYKDYEGYVYAYEFEGKLYLWAYHPGAIVNQEKYANSLIQAVIDWRNK